MQFSLSQEGIEKIKDSTTRVEAAKQIVCQRGGEVQAFHAILGGAYDTMFILNAPNEEKVGQMALVIAGTRSVRTQTHRLFNEDEFRKIIAPLI